MAIPTPADLRQKAKREPASSRPAKTTVKQRKYIAERITNPDATDLEVARGAGYSLTPSAKPSAIKLQNQPLVTQVLRECGLGLEVAVTKLREAMTATRTVVVATANGFETVEITDWAIRLKATVEVLKLHDAYPAAKIKGKMAHTFPQLPTLPTGTSLSDLKRAEKEMEIPYQEAVDAPTV